MTINLDGNLMDFSVPKIMGILNLTPDSFYDGGIFNTDKKILSHVEKMISEGKELSEKEISILFLTSLIEEEGK